jgi:hypothetical protein
VHHRYAVVFLLVALTINGQEEPLPPVVPRATPLIVDAAPAIVLAVEPFHELHTPTLLEAARANDYLTFDALYREAQARGESLTQFATLHELWSRSITDPIGSFYGRDLYERLSRAYPGYAAFIDDYRIIDNNGDAWWPASETRKFLVDLAVEGRAPRVQIATGAPASAPAGPVASRRRVAATPEVEKPVVVATKRAVVKAMPPVVAPPVIAATAVVATPAVVEPVVATPPVVAATVVVAEPPARTAARDAAAPAGVDAGAPNGASSRGILLLVIGIVGVGLLALMLRTPAEAAQEEKPKATVEPIRRSATPASGSPSEPAAPRATGSHG